MYTHASAYPINGQVCYDVIHPNHKCFISLLDKNIEPKNYCDASLDANWVYAMKNEITVLKENKTWTIVHLPQGKQEIGCKRLYKIKYNSYGFI